MYRRYGRFFQKCISNKGKHILNLYKLDYDSPAFLSHCNMDLPSFTFVAAFQYKNNCSTEHCKNYDFERLDLEF